MTIADLTNLNYEVVHYVEGKGYIVKLPQFQFSEEQYLIIDSKTYKTYQIESVRQGLELLQSDYHTYQESPSNSISARILLTLKEHDILRVSNDLIEEYLERYRSIVSYSNPMYLRKFLYAYESILISDVSKLKVFLDSTTIHRESLEFTSPHHLDTEGIIESERSRVSVEEYSVSSSKSSGTTVHLRFNNSAPTNEVFNILRAIYSAVTEQV